MIYTRGGDEGNTSTFTGKRVRKNDDVIEAIGQMDVVVAYLQQNRRFYTEGSSEYKQLSRLIEGLYQMCAEVSNGKASGLSKTVNNSYVERLERSIDELNIKLDHFVDFKKELPISLNTSRVFVRTLERRMTDMLLKEQIRPVMYHYVNRMSDYLFALAVKEEEK